MPSLTGSLIEHQIGLAGSVVIRAASGGVTVQGVDGDVARLSTPSGRDLTEDYIVETAPGRLELTVRPGVVGGLGWLTGRRFDPIHAEVPRGALVRVDTASGSVHIDGLRGEQHYHAASGAIKMSDIAGNVSVDHVSGDVRVRATGPLDLAARTVSGDITASAPTFGTVKFRTMSGTIRIAGHLVGQGPFSVESVSGDVSIELAGPARIEGTSVTGRIRSDLPHREGGSIGRRAIEIGDGGPLLTFRTVSGDLRVTGPAAGSPAETRATTEPAAAASEPAETPAASKPWSSPAPAAMRAAAAGAVPTQESIATEVDEAVAADMLSDRRLGILRDLEDGRIEIDEASRRLADIDADEEQARTRSRTFDIGPLHGELRWDHRA